MAPRNSTAITYPGKIATNFFDLFVEGIQQTIDASLFHLCLPPSNEAEDSLISPVLPATTQLLFPVTYLFIDNRQYRKIVSSRTAGNSAFIHHVAGIIPQHTSLPGFNKNNINRLGITIRPPSL